MKISEIYSFLNEISPFEFQESWDNSGLLVGEFKNEIDKVYLSLDLDSNLIDSIEPNSLLITHHPLIFKPLKRLNFNDFSSKILRELIKKDISLISMHTNFDKTHLNRYVLEKVLGFKLKDKKNENENDFLTTFDVNMSFEDFYNLICEKFNLNNPKVTQTVDFIKTASLVTGSGASFIKAIKSDIFLTGDIKYHDAMEAKEIGLSLIDIGHFQSEIFFSEILKEELESLKKSELKVIISNSNNPFSRGT